MGDWIEELSSAFLPSAFCILHSAFCSRIRRSARTLLARRSLGDGRWEDWETWDIGHGT